jgi:hypothetical protein
MAGDEVRVAVARVYQQRCLAVVICWESGVNLLCDVRVCYRDSAWAVRGQCFVVFDDEYFIAVTCLMQCSTADINNREPMSNFALFRVSC